MLGTRCKFHESKILQKEKAPETIAKWRTTYGKVPMHILPLPRRMAPIFWQ